MSRRTLNWMQHRALTLMLGCFALAMTTGCRGPWLLPQPGDGSMQNSEYPPHLSPKPRGLSRQMGEKDEGVQTANYQAAVDGEAMCDCGSPDCEKNLALAAQTSQHRTTTRRSPVARKLAGRSSVTSHVTDEAELEEMEIEEIEFEAEEFSADDRGGVVASFSDADDSPVIAEQRDDAGPTRIPTGAAARHLAQAPTQRVSTQDALRDRARDQRQEPTERTPLVAPAGYQDTRANDSPRPLMPTGHTRTISDRSVESTQAYSTSEPTEQPSLNELASQLLATLESARESSQGAQRANIAQQEELVRLILQDLRNANEANQQLVPAAYEEFRATLLSLQQATEQALSRAATPRFTQEPPTQGVSSATKRLQVRNAAFCTEVESFGMIKQFPKYQFQPEQQVLLYCELENFVSRQVRDGFETRLQGVYEIVNARGERLVSQILPEDTDFCGNLRRDFYIAYRLNMPVDIAPGTYQLRLIIEDIHGDQYGEAKVKFEIAQ